ncbi:MAG: four helix bundle protein [Prevotella sp.]|uniref:four helix bundle protein n=1 Tax=Prevotella sp. TaxID=59823 RepID=UPI00257CF429|nr:four helix bundle protein [Prevotella sp.]MBS5876061.1 four helix bundle protein [Prevotella sp.]
MKDNNPFNRTDSPLHNKSYDFAIRIVNMVKYIKCSDKEYALTNQVLRSGTAIGALVREAEYAQSASDFINKLSIALKECNETLYWLNLLRDTSYIGEKEAQSVISDCRELLAMLITSVKTAKQRNNKL